MKKLKVSIFIRIRQDGKQRYVPPVWLNKKGRKKGWAMVQPGRPEHRPEGSYALRFMFKSRQRWEGVGKSASEAIHARDSRQWQINNMDTLPDLLKPSFAKEPAKQEEASGHSKRGLAHQKDKFLELKRLTKKPDGSRLDKETLSAYEQQVTEFRAVVGRGHAEEITARHLRPTRAART